MQPFHLAIPVNDLEESAEFYEKILGATKGRSSSLWTDYNFFGHQLVCHLVKEKGEVASNPVDDDDIPVPHFGVVLDWEDFDKLKEDLQEKNFNFYLKPKIRFEGKAGEQATMFIKDPSNNAIEFKAFRDMGNLFSKD
jgi:extradiol dioxygenase family protein